MSIKQKNSDTAAPKGSAWKKNVIFALVVLALAAGVFLAVRAQHPAKGSGLQAVVDFGDGVTETLTLAQDHDYLYEVGDYVVHLQVKDGAIAFLDSQCPDHVCEQFGWLDKDGAWAACVPADGAYSSLHSQFDTIFSVASIIRKKCGFVNKKMQNRAGKTSSARILVRGQHLFP